jgi:hypothetical protein
MNENEPLSLEESGGSNIEPTNSSDELDAKILGGGMSFCCCQIVMPFFIQDYKIPTVSIIHCLIAVQSTLSAAPKNFPRKALTTVKNCSPVPSYRWSSHKGTAWKLLACILASGPVCTT